MSEVERLRKRVEELEELLGLDETVATYFLEAIPTHRARVETIIKLILARPLISTYAIGLAIGNEDLSRVTASVYIWWTRKALAKNGLPPAIIKNDFGRGWYVSPEDKPKLRAVVLSPKRAERTA